jgi:methyltransferase-like protein
MLDEVGRQLLMHLDGKRDRQALGEVLVGLAKDGELNVEVGGQAVSEPDKVREFAKTAVDGQLPELARRALLMA